MRVGLLLAGIAAASAFSVSLRLPGCRSIAHRNIATLQMQESNAELQPKSKAAAKKARRMSLDATSGASVAMDDLEKLQEMEEMEEKSSRSIPSSKKKPVKFPANLFGPTSIYNSEKGKEARGTFSWDPEGLAQAKKSAIFIAIAIFLIQPLSYSGYYVPESNPNNWWEYGQLVKSPTLCTASAQTCANRESTKRSRAEQSQVDNALWQARFKSSNVEVANQFEKERDTSTWWDKLSVYKDGSARDQDRINFETKERQKAAEVQAIANAKKAAEIAKKEAADAEAKKVTEAAEAKKTAADAEAKKVAEAKRAASDAETMKKVAEAKRAASDAETMKKAAEVKKAEAKVEAAPAPDTKTGAPTAVTAASAAANANLPGGWSEAKDPTSGRKYYYNAQRAVQWDVPTSLAKTVAKDAEATIAATAKTPVATTPVTAPTSVPTK